MKTLAVMLILLLAGDFTMFSGHYTHEVWHATRDQLRSIQSYADEKTGSLTRT